MAIKAILAGASGLIGNELLNLLLNNKEYEEVLILVRKELPITHNKLKQHIIDFDLLDNYTDTIKSDVFFCCLGSTKTKTPNLLDYKKVDFAYPLKLAEIASKNDIKQYHLVSALGANQSSFSFYTKLKGDIENAIQQINIPSVHFYRPSLLDGSRNEYRLLEKLATRAMKIINPLLFGSLKKYKSIKATTVARAMLNQSLKRLKGQFIYESDIIKELA